MQYLTNNKTMFVGSGTGGSDEPQRSDANPPSALFLTLLTVIVVVVMIKWINKRK